MGTGVIRFSFCAILLFVFSNNLFAYPHYELPECVQQILAESRGAPLLGEGEIQAVLDGENPILRTRLQEVLGEYHARVGGGQPASDQAMYQVLRDQMLLEVPEHSIDRRLRDLGARKPGSLERALGDLSLEETLELLHGGNPLQPSSNSLIGRYLRESGAASRVRAFTRIPNEPLSPHVGAQRLVISVSESSFELYSRYLLRPWIFGVHAHALVNTDGRLVSYEHNGVGFRLPSPGYALPQVVLKTSEAGRFQTFLDFLITELNAGKSYGLANRAMHPWSIPNYIAAGGYVNCTHWIGNMPVGDDFVEYYAFPTGDNRDGGVVHPICSSPMGEELLARVWRSPGHQQLSDVIGIREQNLRGDMASPGYVIHTLLGETPVERVPFVIYVTQDHHAEIPENFPYTVERAN